MKGKILEFILFLIFYAAIIGLAISMIYEGFNYIISGGALRIILGSILFFCGIFMVINLSSRTNKVVLITIGLLGTLSLLALYGYLTIGLALLPFNKNDVSLDFGFVIIKSNFIKTLIVIFDVVILCNILKWIISIAKKKLYKDNLD